MNHDDYGDVGDDDVVDDGVTIVGNGRRSVGNDVIQLIKLITWSRKEFQRHSRIIVHEQLNSGTSC